VSHRYQSLAEAAKPPDYFELTKVTEKLALRYETCFDYPALAAIKRRILFEVQILRGLFRTQWHLVGYKVSAAHLLR
jgi:hypothetical protein